MADVVFVLIVAVFFGLMVLLVRACDRVIGPDELASSTGSTETSASPASVDAAEAES